MSATMDPAPTTVTAPKTAPAEESRCFGLARRRTVWLPTWPVVLLSIVLLGGASGVFVKTLHPFLEMTRRTGGDLVVVEGWMPDFALRAAAGQLEKNGYTRLIVTGGPIEKGAPFLAYGSYAALGASTIDTMTGRTNFAVAVPAPDVRADRTYAAAVALRRWLAASGPLPKNLDVLTIGPHARRTLLLFRAAFPKTVEVGVIAVPDDRYDASRWWTSSDGFRTTTSEFIAYLYAKFLFRAPPG